MENGDKNTFTLVVRSTVRNTTKYVCTYWICMYVCTLHRKKYFIHIGYEICILLKNTGISLFGNSKLCVYYE